MSTTAKAQLVYVHADCLKEADAALNPGPVPEPAADDAAAFPGLFEALEAQLWRGLPAADEAAAAHDPASHLCEVADASEVLHPVVGIELDA